MHLNFWEGSRTVFIAFKGTEGLTDTVMDLMVVNKNAHGVDSQVTVHTGDGIDGSTCCGASHLGPLLVPC